MDSKEYRSLLGRLPIKSPTPQDMAILCPHLTAEEAVEAFTTGFGYVACPPLRIRHSFQVLSYQGEWVEETKAERIMDGQEIQVVTGTKNHPALLSWSYARRTRASYSDGKSHGNVFFPHKHMDKAMKFAEDNWGDELILDDWVSAVELYVQDPTDLVNDRYHGGDPRTKAILYVTLNRNLGEIFNDHSRPRSEVFDDAIAQMTLDRVIGYELQNGHGRFPLFNCAHCGAGLMLSSCTGCGHRFYDNHFRCGWDTPLSRKMAAFLREKGHEFEVDPEIAWTKEQQNRERSRKEHKEMLRRYGSGK